MTPSDPLTSNPPVHQYVELPDKTILDNHTLDNPSKKPLATVGESSSKPLTSTTLDDTKSNINKLSHKSQNLKISAKQATYDKISIPDGLNIK